MKKIILTLLVTTFLFLGNACSKSDSNNPDPSNACSSVSNFDVTQQADLLMFSISSTSTPLYYQVSYQLASASPDPGYGNTFILNSLTGNKSLNELSIESGSTYVFYARAICTDGSQSNWSGPKVLSMSNYCGRPSFLDFDRTDYSLSWVNAGASNTDCQVQYGVRGFALGTGTIITVSNDYCSGFTMLPNTTYDFYVRSYCEDVNLWSPWSDVYVYTDVIIPCNLPTNLSHQIQSTTTDFAYVTLHWNSNGGENFEYTIVFQGEPITSGTIYSASTAASPVMVLDRDGVYDFYMRTVCTDGSKTAWTAPHLISNL